MKCQCPSSAHGHRPGHCAMEAAAGDHCPRCQAAQKKSLQEGTGKPQSNVPGPRPEG